MALKHAEPGPALAVDAASSWRGGPGGLGRSELMRRIGFTLGALIVFRIGTYVPIPGLDHAVLGESYHSLNGGIFSVFSSGGLWQWHSSSYVFRTINAFSGGAVDRMSIFALSVMPYLSAMMIMQLAAVVWPAVGRWKAEGKSGRKRFNRLVNYGALALAATQGYAFAHALESLSLIIDPGWFFRAQTVVTLACGTMFLVWLSEQITARGVGNGIALIIFAGLVSQLPISLALILELTRTGSLALWLTVFLPIIAVGFVALLAFLERGRRQIFVQFPKRQAGTGPAGGNSRAIALKLNGAGMLPPIFAALMIPVPLTLAGFYEAGGLDRLPPVAWQFGFEHPLYLVLYASLIVLFCFLTPARLLSPWDTANTLEIDGGFVAGIRPGKNTTDYFSYVQTRLTTISAIYLAIMCVLPAALFPWITWTLTMAGAGLVVIVLITLELFCTMHTRFRMRRS